MYCDSQHVLPSLQAAYIHPNWDSGSGQASAREPHPRVLASPWSAPQVRLRRKSPAKQRPACNPAAAPGAGKEETGEATTPWVQEAGRAAGGLFVPERGRDADEEAGGRDSGTRASSRVAAGEREKAAGGAEQGH